MNVLLSYIPCLALCRKAREEDPERQRLFPPPDTILTPPRPRHKLPPIHPGTSSVNSSTQHSPTSGATAQFRGVTSPPLSEASRERIGSISRAYQGRMRPISRHSQPTSTTSSAAPTPHPPRTTFIDPHRPAAPSLGRSVSEPRSLHHLATNTSTPSTADFAAHQLPLGLTADGLTRIGRARSVTLLDRLSPLHARHQSEDDTPRPTPFPGSSRRGRSPGPSRIGGGGFGRSQSAGHMPDLSTPNISEAEEEEGREEEERAVVHRDLGLRDLIGQGSVRRGRTTRGRGSRGGRGGRRTTS